MPDAGRPGLFVALEGGEGTGKTTQAALLADSLEARGHMVLLTREPGSTPAGEIIRSQLLMDEALRLTTTTELMLFMASRAQHLETRIKPALAAGAIVICDRFTLSSMAYQGVGRKLGETMVRSMTDLVVGDQGPDLTLVLDIDPRVARRRIDGRAENTHFDALELSFHQRVRSAFQRYAAADPDTHTLFDADVPQDRLNEQLLACIESRLASAADASRDSSDDLRRGRVE